MRTLGVVLIHGKQGMPGQFQRFADALEGAGLLAERPEMCWSRTRIYDRDYLACLNDIDVAMQRLRHRGAGRIVLLGMSLGGNAVLASGARHADLAGIVALAPAHAPEFISQRPEIVDSLAKARALIVEGRGDAVDEFADVNIGDGSPYGFTTRTTARIYLSFFAADSPAVMPTNAARLAAPLLLVSGTADPTQRGARAIYDAVPSNPKNRFVTVEATHAGTPSAGRMAVFAWLRELPGTPPASR